MSVRIRLISYIPVVWLTQTEYYVAEISRLVFGSMWQARIGKIQT